MKKRSTFGGALIGLGLAITSVGFLATAPSASATPDPGMHCTDHDSDSVDKWNVPEGGGSTTVIVDGVPVTITVDGGSVTFTDAKGDPLVVDYCLKAGTSNTGKKQGSSGNTNDIPNNGGNAPDISYVVVYSVPGPTTPETSATTSPTESTATVLPTESTATVLPTESTATVLPTESTATVLPTESTATVLPTESTATTTPTVLPTASTAPVDPETSTTPTVLPSSRTSSPAMAPTAVDAGLGGGTSEPAVPSSLLILFGAALAVLGLGIGFVPVVAKGKHSH